MGIRHLSRDKTVRTFEGCVAPDLATHVLAPLDKSYRSERRNEESPIDNYDPILESTHETTVPSSSSQVFLLETPRPQESTPIVASQSVEHFT